MRIVGEVLEKQLFFIDLSGVRLVESQLILGVFSPVP